MYEKIEELLGPVGRLLSGSKSSYKTQNPNNLVVFNANVFLSTGDKIWFGDLDIHRNREILKELAMKLKEDLYILYEMDGRFEKEVNPDLEKAPVVFHSEGFLTLKESLKHLYSDLVNG